QLGGGGHVLGGLDLWEYDHVGPRLRCRPQVVLPPRSRAPVDAERGRPAERAASQCGHGEPPRLLLALGGDRVLEVDDHLVGGERRSLCEHPLARGGNGQAGAARSEWHGANANAVPWPWDDDAPAADGASVHPDAATTSTAYRRSPFLTNVTFT